MNKMQLNTMFRAALLLLLATSCGEGEEELNLIDNGAAHITLYESGTDPEFETTKNTAVVLSENGFLTLSFFLENEPENILAISYADDFLQVSEGTRLKSNFGSLSFAYNFPVKSIVGIGTDVELTVTKLDKISQTISGRFEFEGTNTTATAEQIFNGDAVVGGEGTFSDIKYSLN